MTDSAAISPSGAIVHGKFGELPAAATEAIALEYLALLAPAAKGCVALRVLLEKASGGGGGGGGGGKKATGHFTCLW